MSGLCYYGYYVASWPHASVNIANTSDPNDPNRRGLTTGEKLIKNHRFEIIEAAS
jgi:hypothetical protein